MAFQALHSVEEWIERLGDSRKRTVLTLGNFDGVHLGHQQILRRVIERARRENLLAAALTFYPHPARIVRPAESPALLMTLEQRLAAFEAAGIEATLVLRFDADLARMTAEDFVQRFVVGTLRAQAVMVGGNFRFGYRQTGDVELLQALGLRWDFEVHVVPPVVVNGIVVSSTAVRKSIAEGRVEDAARLLGRPFALKGEIRPGTGQGGKLVVPTLNLACEQEALPKHGVYATESLLDEATYRSVTNVGVRPTFDGTRLAIESHLFDFSKNLTGGPMEVRFWTRLRDERKFAGPEPLRAQVLKDIEKAKEYFLQASHLRLPQR